MAECLEGSISIKFEIFSWKPPGHPSGGAPGWHIAFPVVSSLPYPSPTWVNHLVSGCCLSQINFIFRGSLFIVHHNPSFLPVLLLSPFSSQDHGQIFHSFSPWTFCFSNFTCNSRHLTPFHLTLFTSLYFNFSSTVCFVNLKFHYLLLLNSLVFFMPACHMPFHPKYFLKESNSI